MIAEEFQMKSHIKAYYTIWIFLVFVLFFVRFVIIREYDEGMIFNLFIIYAFPTWIAVIAVGFYEGRHFNSYMRRHHHKTWEYLTSGPGFGPGGYNSFRSLPFLFSMDDLGDTNVRSLKDRAKSYLKLMLAVFFSMPIIFAIVMLEY